MLALWIAILMQAQSRKAAFLSGWLFGLGHFVVGLNWIAKAFTFQAAMPEWLGYVAVVLLSLYLAVFPALAALGGWWIGRGRPLVLTVALAGMWIVTEWLRSWLFSGFIWNPLGAVALPLGRIRDLSMVIGSYGLSALLFAGAGGGVLSAASHTMKAGTRLLINTSPEPFSNWTASVAEDATVIGGLWLALAHPAVFIGLLVVFILLAIWLIPKMWRAIRTLFRKIAKLFGRETAEVPPLEGVRVTLGRKSIDG